MANENEKVKRALFDGGYATFVGARCENYGNTTTTIGKELGRDAFISAIAHESMHVGQYLNGQGGQSIFNEVEAYAFESTISMNSQNIMENRFLSQGAQGWENPAGILYFNSMNSLSFGYSQKDFVYSVMTFRGGAQVYSNKLYGNYPMLTPNFNFKSILLNYNPWQE